MKPILIGRNANNKPVVITPEQRQTTHMHVIGGSGTGKSKFLEAMIRKDIDEGHGFCVIDWHGTLYHDILRYCAQLGVGTPRDWRKLILINPSKPEFVTGFNPFMNQGVDLSVQVQRRIDATIRPWGITDTNAMPTFERVCRVLYGFAVEQQETLPTAALLLKFDRPELREFALTVISHPYFRDQLADLQQYKTIRDWRDFVLSTENRIGRFLGSTAVRRFMGMKTGNINLIESMDQGHIILVNLGSSGFLDRESARVFASLFLNEFFESAMLRAQQAKDRGEDKPATYPLYLDEFQEYITDDVAAMLDQVRKGGLHMVLAHQHLAHLASNPRLLQSVLTNARIRAVFGGLPYEDAALLANEMFLPDLNSRQIKKAYYHTIHLFEEQTRIIRSRGSSHTTSHSTGHSTGGSSGFGSSSGYSSGSTYSSGSAVPGVGFGDAGVEGWFSEGESHSQAYSSSSSSFSSDSWSDIVMDGESDTESESETVVPVWVPIPVKELGSEAEWSREEKVSKVAQMLKEQMQRHCFIKLDTEKTQPLKVPFVKEYFIPMDYLLEYEQEVYNTQGALPAAQVDQIVADNETQFINRALQAVQSQQSSPAPPPQSQPARSPRARPQKPKSKTI